MRRLAVAAALLVLIAGAAIGIEFSGGPRGAGETPVADHPYHFVPVAASFVSPQDGFELGYFDCHYCSVLRVTHDGGATWRSLPSQHPYIPLETRARRSISDLVFATRTDGWLFGPGLWDSDNGGRAFGLEVPTPVLSVQVGRRYAYALSGIGALGRGKLWRTALGNEHWTHLVLPAAAHGELGLTVAGNSLMLLHLGDDLMPGHPGEIWMSRNRGANWERRTMPCRGGYRGAATLVGAVEGSPHSWLLDCFSSQQSSQETNTLHRLYLTRNDGRSWHELAVPAREGGPIVLEGTRNGHFFLGVSGVSDGFYGSFDGGRHWHLLLTHTGFFGWGDLHFVDARTGFLVGPTRGGPEYGPTTHVYRTDDGGRHWKVISAS